MDNLLIEFERTVANALSSVTKLVEMTESNISIDDYKITIQRELKQKYLEISQLRNLPNQHSLQISNLCTQELELQNNLKLVCKMQDDFETLKGHFKLLLNVDLDLSLYELSEKQLRLLWSCQSFKQVQSVSKSRAQIYEFVLAHSDQEISAHFNQLLNLTGYKRLLYKDGIIYSHYFHNYKPQMITFFSKENYRILVEYVKENFGHSQTSPLSSKDICKQFVLDLNKHGKTIFTKYGITN